MTIITNNFLPRSISIDNLINYVLADSDDLVSDDPILNELTSDSIPNIESQKNQETPFKNLKRKHIDSPNQFIAKKALLNPNSSSPENSVTMSSSFKRRLIDTINQTYNRADALSLVASLEKAQICYADQLNIDLQEVKNIYVAVTTHCSTANESSVIKTKTANCSRVIDPQSKKNLVEAINRSRDKVKPFNLKRIQAYCTEQLKKLDTSTYRPTIITKTSSPKELDVLDLSLKKYCVVIISPETKKSLVRNINHLFHATDASLEEIQTRYANQLEIDLQEIKKIYLAVSANDPSANETSEIKQKQLNDLI